MTQNRFLTRVLLAFLLFAFVTISSSYAQEPAAEETTASSDGGIPTDPARISAGKELFNGNCKTCHRIDKKLVGPALMNVYDRAPSLEWIVSFVQNSSKVIASGDKYANDLYAEYNNTQMTAFSSFSPDMVMSIMAYVQDETNKLGDIIEDDDKVTKDDDKEAGVPAFYLNAIMIGLVIVLVLILIVLVLITTILKKYLTNKGDLNESDAEIVNSSFSVEKLVRAKPFIFLVTFIFAAVVFKVVINNLYAVGIQKGYAPKQPIAFSHEIHAGQYEIDCQYCHTGVRKSKSANIPSPNICMNCHSAVKTESPEIQKIYAAIEDNKPIEWIRIHNLPDLAYFNHSQHVEVGGIECQTCHGEIQEMAVVEQHALLTMGWCIDCHRKTDVNAKGNEYYDNLLELHESESKEPLKVEDIGGLECSKCHY